MRRLTGAVLAVFTAALIASPSLAASKASSTKASSTEDTLRFVKRVSVGSGGVHVSDHDAKVSVGSHGVEVVEKGDVHVDEDRDVRVSRKDRVTIRGPVVIVDEEGSNIVRVFADAKVDSNERIDGDAVAVFGSVEVDGEVTGDVVAVFGSVTLGPHAQVGGDAVAVGGALIQPPGATVSGESVSIGIFSWAPSLPALPMIILTILICWVFGLIFAWILQALFHDRMVRISLTSSRRTAGAFLLGLASAPLLVIAVVLLSITFIGIPIGIGLSLAYFPSAFAGYLAASYVLGCRLLRRPLEGGNYMAPVAVGTLFVAGFFVLGAVLFQPEGAVRTFALFFTLLGFLLITGLTTVGLGALILSRFGQGPSASPAAPAPIPSAPMDPMASQSA
jgi:hypothetical protein